LAHDTIDDRTKSGVAAEHHGEERLALISPKFELRLPV
jgi:hypothetical protein